MSCSFFYFRIDNLEKPGSTSYITFLCYSSVKRSIENYIRPLFLVKIYASHVFNFIAEPLGKIIYFFCNYSYSGSYLKGD